MIIDVVRVEGAPAAVPALHALDPLGGAINRGTVAYGVVAMHGERHHRAVVDIRIMRVGVLEGPAARPHIGAPLRPVALDVEDLPLGEPVESTRRRIGRGATPFHEPLTNQPLVPYPPAPRLPIA